MRDAAIGTRGAAPRARAAKASGQGTGKRRGFWARALGRAAGPLRRHPGRTAAGAACLLMAGGIVGNAVMFQSGRHPAPLFGHGPPPAADDTAVPPRAIAPPPPSPGPAPLPVSAAPPPLQSRPEDAKAHGSDAIARILDTRDSPIPKADPKLAAAQRALARLGFPVKPDGVMAASTRKALESFERGHHLPIEGDLSPKLLHALDHDVARSHRSSDRDVIDSNEMDQDVVRKPVPVLRHPPLAAAGARPQ